MERGRTISVGEHFALEANALQPSGAGNVSAPVSPPAPRRRTRRRRLASELLADVYAARDLARARRRLVVFFQHAADDDIPS